MKQQLSGLSINQPFVYEKEIKKIILSFQVTQVSARTTITSLLTLPVHVELARAKETIIMDFFFSFLAGSPSHVFKRMQIRCSVIG